MATIKELRARFVAEAQGIKGVFRDIQKDMKGLSKSSEDTTKSVNKDFERMEKSLKNVQDALKDAGNVEGFKDLEKAMKDAQKSLKETGDIGEKELKAIGKATASVKGDFNEMSDESKEAVKKLSKSLTDLDNDLRDMGKGKALDGLVEDLKETNEELKDVKKNADKAADATGEVGSAKTQKGVEGVGKGFGAVKVGALALVGAVAGVAAGIVGLIKTGDDLQKAYNVLQTQTGATAEEMQGMEESLKNIYRNNYGESFDDIARSMANVKQVTDLTGKELENMTSQALLLRDTFGYEVEESVRAADTMMKNFGISAEEAYTLIAQGAQMGADKGGELLDTLNEYAPQFKAVGFDAEYMMDTLISGAKNGAFSIDKIGDAVKEMNIRMKDGNEETGEALANLGLNADKTRKAFAEGGDAGREAFEEVMQALIKIEDPMEKNRAGVAIFGTQFEDLESEAIDALAGVDYYTNMTGDTLKELDKIKYNSVGDAIKGVGRILMTDMVLPLQEKIMPFVNDSINKLKSGIESTSKQLKPFKEYLEAIFSIMSGNEGKAVSILTRLGLSPAQITQLTSVIEGIKTYFVTMFKVWTKYIGGIKDIFVAVFDFLAPYIMPILNEIVSFVQSQLAVLSQFWKENGEQIMEAVDNAFKVIKAIIDFVMPAILFIIKMVWGNIQGVIKGALNIIMGAIKIFAGIFTGDFKKMWEGVVQLFKGALEFVWNLINLLLVGRVLKAIWSFIKMGIAAFKSLFTKTLDIFKNLDKSVGKVVDKLVGFLKKSWTKAKDEAASIFTNMKNGMKQTFDDMVSSAKALPGKIGAGIKKMAGKAANGAISMVNRILRGWGKGANGLIGGINWVLGKMGVDKKIPEWEVPQYAKGTDKKGHPGGLAIVGERGRELAWVPGVGPIMVGQKGEEMLNLPAGTSVLPNKDTENLVKAGVIPGYASGVGDFLKDAGGKVVDTVKKGAAGVGDFFTTLAKGAKGLISKVWDNFLVFPEMSGLSKDIAHGAIKKVKNSATEYLKKKLDGFMSDGGGFMGSGNVPGNVTSWITQALGITGKPMSWLGALTTMAMKESGGRTGPSTINKWDSNWRRGTPSMGLMQTIMPTFNAYKVPGLNDIMNPVHNAAAAINYIVARYGTPYNTPGIRSMAAGGPYKGYEKGGFVNQEHVATVGEGGKEEVIIPLEQHRSRALSLWKMAGEKLGMNNETMALFYNGLEKVFTRIKGIALQTRLLLTEAKRDLQPMSNLALSNGYNLMLSDPALKGRSYGKVTSGKLGMNGNHSETDVATLAELQAIRKVLMERQVLVADERVIAEVLKPALDKVGKTATALTNRSLGKGGNIR